MRRNLRKFVLPPKKIRIGAGRFGEILRVPGPTPPLRGLKVLPASRLFEGKTVFCVEDRPAERGDFAAQLVGERKVSGLFRLPPLARELRDFRGSLFFPLRFRRAARERV